MCRFVEQAEGVVVLSVEVQQARLPVCVPVRHLQVIGQDHAVREHRVDVLRNPRAGVEMERGPTGHVHGDGERPFWHAGERARDP